MAGKVEFVTKISPEGRVVIPAEVRRALGVAAGDRVRLVLEEGEVRIMSARTMAVSLWANNQGGENDDSVADIRRFRAGDRALSDTRFEQLGQAWQTLGPRSRSPMTSWPSWGFADDPQPRLVGGDQVGSSGARVEVRRPGPPKHPQEPGATLSLGAATILAVSERIGAVVLTGDKDWGWMLDQGLLALEVHPIP